MSSRVGLVAPCAAAALAFAGCYESHPGVSVAQRDGAGLDGAIDRDAGPAALDGGAFDGSAARADAAADAGALACDAPITPYEGLGCASATRACVAACPDAACANDCILADRECVTCIDRTLVSCANALGCEDEWFDLACCAQAEPECAGRSGLELLACADACDEVDAYDACVGSIDTTSCGVEITSRCMI